MRLWVFAVLQTELYSSLCVREVENGVDKTLALFVIQVLVSAL